MPSLRSGAQHRTFPDNYIIQCVQCKQLPRKARYYCGTSAPSIIVFDRGTLSAGKFKHVVWKNIKRREVASLLHWKNWQGGPKKAWETQRHAKPPLACYAEGVQPNTEKWRCHHGMSSTCAEKKKKVRAAMKSTNGEVQSKRCKAASVLLLKMGAASVGTLLFYVVGYRIFELNSCSCMLKFLNCALQCNFYSLKYCLHFLLHSGCHITLDAIARMRNAEQYK